MSTLRLYIALLALAQAFAYPTAVYLGAGWSLALSAVSAALGLFVTLTTSAELTQPHPAQRADSYRVAAQRAEEAVRVVRPKRRVLHAEFAEADSGREGWALALFTVTLVAAIAGTALYAGVQWALVPTILLAIGAVVCLIGFVACNRTVRAWRDQERGER